MICNHRMCVHQDVIEQHAPEHRAWAGSLLTNCHTFREYTYRKIAAVIVTYYDIGRQFVGLKNCQILYSTLNTSTLGIVNGSIFVSPGYGSWFNGELLPDSFQIHIPL